MSGQYIFKPPADIPPMTWEGLQGVSQIGTTLSVLPSTIDDAVHIRLYETIIATIRPDEVYLNSRGYASQATRFWLERIVRDNHLGTSVWREKKRYLIIRPGEPDILLDGSTHSTRKASA